MNPLYILVFLTLSYPSQEPPAAIYELEARHETWEDCWTEAVYVEWKLNNAALKLKGLHFDVLCKELKQ